MDTWIELTAREKQRGLPHAVQRQIGPGRVRYAFVHDTVELDDPSMDITGRYFVSPKEYGFAIRGFVGGRTAWARDFANGTMLVVNREGSSHVLSPKGGSRILFIGPQGEAVQDTGLERQASSHTPDLYSVRLHISATVDLHGESPETARAVITRMLDQALITRSSLPGSRVQLLHHTYESSHHLADDKRSSSETGFSRLLDI